MWITASTAELENLVSQGSLEESAFPRHFLIGLISGMAKLLKNRLTSALHMRHPVVLNAIQKALPATYFRGFSCDAR